MMVIPGSDVDEGWAWVVLLASYFNLLMCSGLSYVAGMFQLVFLEQFQSSVAFTSWITALFSSFMQLGGPLSSVVSNNFNCRTSVMLGGVLMSVGMFVSSMANSLEMLFVTFGLVAGAGIGLTYTSSIIVLNYFFEERRTLVTGVALSASGLGILASPQISRFLFDNFSWRETLVIMSGVAAHVCVTGAAMSSMHETKRRHRILRKIFSCTPWCKDRGDSRIHRYSDTKGDVIVQLNSSTYSPNEEAHSLRNGASELNEHEEVFPCPSCISGEKCCKHYRADHAVASASINLPNVGSSKDTEFVSLQTVAQNITSSSAHGCDFERASASPLPDASVYAGHGKRIDNYAKTNMTGSHQELTARPLLRITALTNAANSRSHQELSKPKGLFNPSKTVSNPNLIRKLGDSKTSLDPEYRIDHVVVVSRNPSLLGLVPFTSPLNVIITSTEELQNNPSLRSSSILESKLILTEFRPLSKTLKAAPDSLTYVESDGLESFTDSETRQFPPLYRNKYFWVLCISLFVENAGCGIFNIHFPSFVKTYGLPDQQLTNILSVNGFAILFGRCLCGALANAEKENDLLIWWALHVLGGVCVCIMPSVGDSYVGLIILVYGMGNYYGTVYAVLSAMTIEMVGLTSLATAFGVEMVCAGLGYFVSPPIAGLVVDLTGNYDHSMYSAGMFYVTGGMLIFMIPLLWPSKQQADPSDVKLTADHEIENQDCDK